MSETVKNRIEETGSEVPLSLSNVSSKIMDKVSFASFI